MNNTKPVAPNQDKKLKIRLTFNLVLSQMAKQRYK